MTVGLLTADEECALAVRIQAGDIDARNELVTRNLGLVHQIARQISHPKVPLDDRVQEGTIGLMTAADRFDPARGCRFADCAGHWIRRSILRAIDSSDLIRVSFGTITKTRKYRRDTEAGSAPRFRQDTIRIIAKATTARQMATLAIDLMADHEGPLDAMVHAEDLSRLTAALANLSARDLRVIAGSFGIGRDCELFREIGAEIGCTRWHACRIRRRVIDQLRRALA